VRRATSDVTSAAAGEAAQPQPSRSRVTAAAGAPPCSRSTHCGRRLAPRNRLLSRAWRASPSHLIAAAA
jgi:hypothetical protein